MRVKVLYFGVLKELFGAEWEMVEIAEGSDLSSLYDHLKKRTSNTIEVWPSLAVAVNREYAGASVALHEGDEVALLPPVSGGKFALGEKPASLAEDFARGLPDAD